MPSKPSKKKQSKPAETSPQSSMPLSLKEYEPGIDEIEQAALAFNKSALIVRVDDVELPQSMNYELCLSKVSMESITEGRLSIEKTAKSNKDIHDLILRFDKKSEMFNFPDVHHIPMEIGNDDIVNTFGVARGAKKIIMKRVGKPSNSVLAASFGERKRLEIKALRDTLMDTSKKSRSEALSLTCQLLTLCILITLLVSGIKDYVPWFYVELLSDIEGMKSYDWAEYVHRVLISSLKKSKTAQDVSGCLMIIPVMSLRPTTRLFTLQSKAKHGFKLPIAKESIDSYER